MIFNLKFNEPIRTLYQLPRLAPKGNGDFHIEVSSWLDKAELFVIDAHGIGVGFVEKVVGSEIKAERILRDQDAPSEAKTEDRVTSGGRVNRVSRGPRLILSQNDARIGPEIGMIKISASNHAKCYRRVIGQLIQNVTEKRRGYTILRRSPLGIGR